MFKCDKCGEIDHVLVDGYAVGDRMLEGVMFEVRLGKKKGTYKAKVVQESAEYFSELNEKKWLKEIEKYASELDCGACPKCENDVDMPNELPERKPVKLAMTSFQDILKGALSPVQVPVMSGEAMVNRLMTASPKELIKDMEQVLIRIKDPEEGDIVVRATEAEWQALIKPAVDGKCPIDASNVDEDMFDKLLKRPKVDLKLSEVKKIDRVLPIV